MAGKKISQLTAETPVRTDVIAQQDSVGANDARKSTIAEVLQLIETTDITDLSATLALYLDKATFTDGTNILLSKLSQGGATTDQVLAWSGTEWAPADTAILLDQQAVYVSKAGNDANSGLNPNEPKLTISAAISAADTAGYSLVHVLDGGTYAEAVTCIDGIDLWAPNAVLSFNGTQQLTLAGQRTVLNGIVRSAGGGSCVLNTGAGDTSTLKIEYIIDNGSGVTVRNTQPTTLILVFGIIDVRGGGVGIADFAAAAHTHLEGQDIYLRSNGATGVQRTNAGLTVARIEHIVLKDAATGTVAIDCNDGVLDINVQEINVATAYDIASGATLGLVCNDLNGTTTNAGTFRGIVLNDASVLDGSLTCTDAIADTLTIDGTELDPTGHTAGQLLISDGTDFVANDFWEDWVTPTKSGTWTNLAGQAVVRYRRSRDGEFIFISGYAEKGGAATLFNLPVGYRPSADTYGSIFGSGGTTGSGPKRLLVKDDGDVDVMSNSDGYDGTSSTWAALSVLIGIT